ncbi:MAG TPA: hypothetical protein VF988_17805 [Verrucomicrobiae bacterium]
MKTILKIGAHLLVRMNVSTGIRPERARPRALKRSNDGPFPIFMFPRNNLHPIRHSPFVIRHFPHDS